MQKVEKKKFPHTLVILLIVILIAVALTWIIPAGEYLRVEDASGRKVVDPESFHFIEQQPVNPLTIFNISMDGFVSTATLIFTILFSGAAFNMITQSGALHSLIGVVSEKTKKREYLFILALTLVFALICTVKGVNTFIGFAPIMVMIAISLGYDSIVGAGIILLGGAVGFSTGTLNPSTTLVAQDIAGLAPYSGIGYRVVSFIAFYIVTNIYLIKYATKIKVNPKASPMYELDKQRNYDVEANEEFRSPMTTRKWLIILALFGALGLMVYGGVSQGWGLTETGAIFIWLSIIVGFIAGFKPSTTAKYFIDGAKTMIGAAIIIGLARTISGVLSAGNIMDTSIYYLSRSLTVFPLLLRGPVMFITNIIVNMFITSGSGQSAAIMPIFAPLADMIGLSRQAAVLAFNFGDGFCNYILPTSTALMGILGATNIPYDKWMMFMWKLFMIWIIVGSILMVGAQVIGYV